MAGRGQSRKPEKSGGLRLRRMESGEFELDHPPCIYELEPDYEEGMELWKAGEPEEARDSLRFALQGCGDNMYVHVALGGLALEIDRDANLARGHFGYAFELAERTLPRGFAGTISRNAPPNRPLYEAVEGLIQCYRSLGQPAEAERLESEARRWSGVGRP